MTDDIRRVIREKLAAERLTQGELQQRSGVRSDYISKLLRGERGKAPEEWLRILDALNLELFVKEKGETK